jgi:hypothetical protein
MSKKGREIAAVMLQVWHMSEQYDKSEFVLDGHQIRQSSVLDPDHLCCPSSLSSIVHRNLLRSGDFHLGTWPTSSAVIITLTTSLSLLWDDGSGISDSKNNGGYLLISISLFFSPSPFPLWLYNNI